ncbi:MAG: CheR family methyltransferase [Pseudomonadota bacterium]
MKPEELDYLSKLVRRTSGLVVTKEKVYLLESRLKPLATQKGFTTLSDMVASLRQREDPSLVTAVTEAMTTNETFFFRDKTPFEVAQEMVFPYLAQKYNRRGKARIWTAAASSGQEIYSIAILAKEMRNILGSLELELLGSDISRDVLEKAKAGIYSQFEVQRGLSAPRLVKNFERQGEQWRISPDLRAMCQFRYLNLLDDFRTMGTFDVIFCRNVLIYFDPETKKNVLERLAKLLPEDGLLFLGAAETVVGVTKVFQPVRGRRGLYARNPGLFEKNVAAA